MQPGEPDAHSFDRMLGWIGEQFHMMAPLEACERLFDGTLPARAALISFDDGYRDNFEVALPILQRHRMQALFFIASSYLDPVMPFNDRVREALRVVNASSLDLSWMDEGVVATDSIESKLRALPRLLDRVKYLVPNQRESLLQRLELQCGQALDEQIRRDRPMMTPDQVRALAKSGMEIGGHTHSHPILRLLSPVAAMVEIQRGRDELNGVLDHAPLIFSYPNGKLHGDFEPEHRDMVQQAGFRYAFSTHRGVATSESNRYMLPRFMPWHHKRLHFQAQALRVAFGFSTYRASQVGVTSGYRQ